MVAFVTRAGKGSALTFDDGDDNLAEIERRTGSGYRDLVSPLTIDGVPTEYAPTYQSFGPSGLRKELVFEIGDYAFSQAFHVNHDILVGGNALVHVHWSTNGTSVQPVKWEFQISRAIGHNQAYFGAEVSLYKQQSSNGGAWRHMVAEVDLADALTLTEPDELILVTLRRVTNGATDNTDQVFGLLVDFHYQSDRNSSPNRSPNFYT